MNPTVRMIGLTQPYDDPDYPSGSLPLSKPVDLIEFAGRWDYGEQSVAKMTGEDTGIIGRWLATGEESMVEMVDATFLITCSRVVSHELVRHRIASYQQESQRFVKYEDEDGWDLFYVPPEGLPAANPGLHSDLIGQALMFAHGAYQMLREAGVSKQIARYVLPNATRTRIIAKMNLREWRHVLGLRMHTSAQPEMRLVAAMIHAKLNREFGDALFPPGMGEERQSR